MGEVFQKIVDYLNQSGADWIPMYTALDGNIIAVVLLLLSYFILSISFYTVIYLLYCSIRAKGFFNEEHKKLSIWFMLFLFLVGTSFSAETVTMFYPFYWVYSVILVATGTSALLTVTLYCRYFERLSAIPSGEEIIRLKEENETLKDKQRILEEYVELTKHFANTRLTGLKEEHRELVQELRDTTNFDVKPLLSEDAVVSEENKTLTEVQD